MRLGLLRPERAPQNFLPRTELDGRLTHNSLRARGKNVPIRSAHRSDVYGPSAYTKECLEQQMWIFFGNEISRKPRQLLHFEVPHHIAN